MNFFTITDNKSIFNHPDFDFCIDIDKNAESKYKDSILQSCSIPGQSPKIDQE